MRSQIRRGLDRVQAKGSQYVCTGPVLINALPQVGQKVDLNERRAKTGPRGEFPCEMSSKDVCNMNLFSSATNGPKQTIEQEQQQMGWVKFFTDGRNGDDGVCQNIFSFNDVSFLFYQPFEIILSKLGFSVFELVEFCSDRSGVKMVRGTTPKLFVVLGVQVLSGSPPTRFLCEQHG